MVLSLFTDVMLCPFKSVLGVPCLACGMTRAFFSLLRLDFRQAFRYHPLFFTVPFLPLLLLDALPAKLRSWTAWGLLALFVGVWALRMVLLFPHTSPMDFNENAVLPMLWNVIIEIIR